MHRPNVLNALTDIFLETAREVGKLDQGRICCCNRKQPERSMLVTAAIEASGVKGPVTAISEHTAWNMNERETSKKVCERRAR